MGNIISINNNGGGDKVEIVSIDTLYKSMGVTPTLIKFDIEGLEVDALIGAQKLITERAPKLQISLYHKPDHLWQIGLMLKKMVPSYRFFLGSHIGGYLETVLYAVNC